MEESDDASVVTLPAGPTAFAAPRSRDAPTERVYAELVAAAADDEPLALAIAPPAAERRYLAVLQPPPATTTTTTTTPWTTTTMTSREPMDLGDLLVAAWVREEDPEVQQLVAQIRDLGMDAERAALHARLGGTASLVGASEVPPAAQPVLRAVDEGLRLFQRQVTRALGVYRAAVTEAARAAQSARTLLRDTFLARSRDLEAIAADSLAKVEETERASAAQIAAAETAARSAVRAAADRVIALRSRSGPVVRALLADDDGGLPFAEALLSLMERLDPAEELATLPSPLTPTASAAEDVLSRARVTQLEQLGEQLRVAPSSLVPSIERAYDRTLRALEARPSAPAITGGGGAPLTAAVTPSPSLSQFPSGAIATARRALDHAAALRRAFEVSQLAARAYVAQAVAARQDQLRSERDTGLERVARSLGERMRVLRHTLRSALAAPVSETDLLLQRARRGLTMAPHVLTTREDQTRVALAKALAATIQGLARDLTKE